MRPDNERVEELRRLYKEAYGREISMEEARDMARRLIEFYRVLKRPSSDEKAENGAHD